MNKLIFRYTLLLLVIAGCKPEVSKYTILGTISGGAGKYLKIIDMTMPGLPHDSIQLDMGGKFKFEKTATQPGDYIFYFQSADYFRITPLPHEIITIEGNYGNLIESFKISGSPESEGVSQIIKFHHNSTKIIDTLNQFYMKNQLHPQLDTLVKKLTFIADSVITNEKLYFENYIKTHPGTFASYVALSQKFNPNHNLFTLQNDLQYFEMVDTALANRYDTIDIVTMMHAYIANGKMQMKQAQNLNQYSLLNKAAPEILLPNVYGDTLSLASLRGKYVLVDFWASWCRPCRKENENLRQAYRKYKNMGFEIFQVALERDKTDWKNSIREDKLYWKNQVSELNYMNSKTAKTYKIKALPANYLINPQGIVIAKDLYGEQLLMKLNELLAPKPISTKQNGE